MYPFGADDVMGRAPDRQSNRDKSRLDTAFQERKAVLPYDNGIGIAMYKHQVALQISSFQVEIGRFIPFGVGLRGSHVTFSVHDFIVLPIDDRTSGHAYLENISVRQHEVGRHKTAEAPTMYAYTGRVAP